MMILCTCPGAQLLMMHIRHVPLDPVTMKVDIIAMRKMINRNTCMVSYFFKHIYGILLNFCMCVYPVCLLLLCSKLGPPEHPFFIIVSMHFCSLVLQHPLTHLPCTLSLYHIFDDIYLYRKNPISI